MKLNVQILLAVVILLIAIGCDRNKVKFNGLKNRTVYSASGIEQKIDNIDNHGILFYFANSDCQRCFIECRAMMLALGFSEIKKDNRPAIVFVIRDKCDLSEMECGGGSAYYALDQETKKLFNTLNINKTPQSVFLDKNYNIHFLGNEFSMLSFFESTNIG